jgi:NAD(P)-dependent dehydrogenase (short-subunit alcohol dehydrogenase family)
LFHDSGANVVIADLPQTESTACSLINSLSERAIFVPTDILSWSSMQILFQKTRAQFGSVEIVVANAGMMEGTEFFREELDRAGELVEPKGAYKVLDVNLRGTMNS